MMLCRTDDMSVAELVNELWRTTYGPGRLNASYGLGSFDALGEPLLRVSVEKSSR